MHTVYACIYIHGRGPRAEIGYARKRLCVCAAETDLLELIALELENAL